MDACFSTAIRVRTDRLSSRLNYAISFCLKAREFSARKHCWQKSRENVRDLSKYESGERSRLACWRSRPRDRELSLLLIQYCCISAKAPKSAREARALPNPTISNPINPSPAFSRASISPPRKHPKDIFALPISSRARTGQRCDRDREHGAIASLQESRILNRALVAFGHESFQTSGCALARAAKI